MKRLIALVLTILVLTNCMFIGAYAEEPGEESIVEAPVEEAVIEESPADEQLAIVESDEEEILVSSGEEIATDSQDEDISSSTTTDASISAAISSITAEPGDNVDVCLTLSGDCADLCCAEVWFSFNSDVLEPILISKLEDDGKTYNYVDLTSDLTTGTPIATVPSIGTCRVLADAAGKFGVDSISFQLKFKVKEDAEPGEYQFIFDETNTEFAIEITDEGYGKFPEPIASSNVTYSAGNLTVEKAFEITAQPQSLTSEAGKNVTFTVVTNDPDNTAYQWQYRTSASGTWANSGVSGCNTDTITVAAYATRNGYQYRCKVTKGAKTIESDAATLTIGSSFEITAQPQSLTSEAGKNVTFTVVTNDPDNTAYQWQYRTSASGNWSNSGVSGYNTDTINVVAYTTRNGYQYRCKVTSGSKSLYSDPATLTIGSQFEITTQPQSITSEAGKSVSFTVVTSDPENTTYQWQYRTSASGNWSNSGVSGCNTDTINVVAYTTRNGYQYRCKVTKGSTTLTSEAATLAITT